MNMGTRREDLVPVIEGNLPHDLDGELNFASRCLRGVYLAEAGYGRSGGVESLEIIHRWSKVRVVDDVEELGAELHIQVFTNVVVLDHGEVEIDQSGPMMELRASVPNQPGVVAQLALELGRAGVNITDMALYPAPDMSEGVIALWIAGEEQARRTEELVATLGFPVARA